MARIDRVVVHHTVVPMLRPFVTAQRTAYSVDTVLVQVFDTDGRCGWGEAPTSWRVTGESAASVSAAVEGPLREALVGLSAEEPDAAGAALERAVVRNSSARMALECALFDLASQGRDVPLFAYLGGHAPEVATDMTVSATTNGEGPETLLATVAEHVAQGFTTLKIKVGAGGDDAGTMLRVREAVGPAVTLRVDANQGWTPELAIRTIRRLEDEGVDVEFVEQPVHRDDLDGLAQVTAEVDTPILADESVWTRRDLREVLLRRAVDMVNVKLAKTGGLREARAIIELAQRSGLRVLVGCMAETHVGIAAAAALASAVDASQEPSVHDLDGGLWLTRSPVVGGVTYDGPRVRLADAPGTGILKLSGP